MQPLTPEEAINRAKESAAQIVSVKGLIEKKAWPYVQNDLRSKAGYLRFDLNTVINAKPKAQKKELTALANKLYDSIAAVSDGSPSRRAHLKVCRIHKKGGDGTLYQSWAGDKTVNGIV